MCNGHRKELNNSIDPAVEILTSPANRPRREQLTCVPPHKLTATQVNLCPAVFRAGTRSLRRETSLTGYGVNQQCLFIATAIRCCLGGTRTQHRIPRPYCNHNAATSQPHGNHIQSRYTLQPHRYHPTTSPQPHHNHITTIPQSHGHTTHNHNAITTQQHCNHTATISKPKSTTLQPYSNHAQTRQTPQPHPTTPLPHRNHTATTPQPHSDTATNITTSSQPHRNHTETTSQPLRDHTGRGLSPSCNYFWLFFFRMLALSYIRQNFYTQPLIPLLYNLFTIVLHKRLSVYMF